MKTVNNLRYDKKTAMVFIAETGIITATVYCRYLYLKEILNFR